LARIYDLGVGKLHLDVFDASFDETLLLACGVVFRVLRQVTMAARLRDRLDDARTRLGLQPLELGAQRLGAARCHGCAFHALSASLCRSCRRFTSTSSRWSIASHVARPAARVV